MKRIPMFPILVFLVFVESLIFTAQAQKEAIRSFTLNSVEDRSSSGTVTVTQPDHGNLLYVDLEPVLTQADLTSAQVTTRKGRVILQVTLNDLGATKLEDFSARHVGRKLALMVNGRVVKAPEIRVPLYGHGFEVDAFNKSEANQVADLINRKSSN